MYDAIVVGARCAGSPTAMLLARKGYRVLLVDRAGFPSDSLSTHYIHQPGVARLARWGLLDSVIASNCPPARQQCFDAGPFTLCGTPTAVDGVKDAYAPRRTVLDSILVDAAATAGAEVREHFSVSEIVTEGSRVIGIRGRAAGGSPVLEKARIVIGADGLHSLVARQVQAPTTLLRPTYTCAYFTYFSELPVAGAELYPRPGRMIIAAPTNDAQAFVIVYWPHAMFHQVRADIAGHFFAALDLAPSLAERVRQARQSERFRGTGDLRNFFRRPYGPGWALVGDAGYHKDPITAQGISDAFRDAELLAEAIDDGLAGRSTLDEALAEYERRRDAAAMAIFEMTCQLATLEPPPAEMEQLFGALRHNQAETDRFFGAIAGTVPIPEFFSPENLGAIIAGTEATAA